MSGLLFAFAWVLMESTRLYSHYWRYRATPTNVAQSRRKDYPL